MRREPHQLSNSFDTIHKPTLHEREMEKGRGGNDGNSSTLETERMMLLRQSTPAQPDTPKKLFSFLTHVTLTIEALPRLTKFCLLVLGLFFFFGLHNLLQEKIMHFPGFTFGWTLGFLEVLGVTFFSYWERKWAGEGGVRRASLRAYLATTLCLLGSSSLSNKALDYINYPTKVVFRSCKLIPTMVIAGVMNKKTFTGIEYMAALAVCLGLIFFAFADVQVAPAFSPWGITLVSLSVVCDAILPNLQVRLFEAGSSRLEVTFYSNIMTLVLMSFSTLLSGDLLGALAYARSNQTAAVYLVMYTLLAYLAISLHMTMVQSFGSVAAVLVGNSRKTMTICLSFLLFPKPFSPLYVWGGMLVLGGLTGSAYMKAREKGGGKGGGGGGGGGEKVVVRPVAVEAEMRSRQ